MAFEVLLIDGDPRSCATLRSLLNGHDFQVQAAHRVEDGIKRCHKSSPDAIILDLSSSGLEGWEVCSRIRELSRAPIIVLATVGLPWNVARSLEAGADDYLLKPVHGGMLVSRLYRHIRKRATTPSEQLVH